MFQLLVDRSDRAADILPPEEIQADQMLAAGGIFPIGKQQDEEFYAPLSDVKERERALQSMDLREQLEDLSQKDQDIH